MDNKWRDASRPMNIFGIPVWLFLFYIGWFFMPCMNMIYICTFLIIFFKGISMYGYTFRVLCARMIKLFRGNLIKGRSWLYRQFLNGED